MGTGQFDLIVGLGNPGKRYESTRHNIGFIVVEELVHRARVSLGPEFFSCNPGEAWREEKRFEAFIAECRLAEARILVQKPLTFMNRSGHAVRALAEYFKIEPRRIAVIHDELDLPFGTLRLRAGGGPGGHNGLRSLIDELGSNDFVRIRVGIGRPPRAQSDDSPCSDGPEVQHMAAAYHMSVSDWVLSRFDDAEQGQVPGVVGRCVESLRVLCAEGLVAAQRQFN